MIREKRIDAILIFLVCLDSLLSGIVFFAPQFWFDVFHGTVYIDPQGLLRRTGAAWAAFALFQLIGLIRWRKAPYWLAVIAGIRFGDIFTDWTYLLFCAEITPFGRIGLLVASPINVVIGCYLLKACSHSMGHQILPWKRD